MCPAWLADRDDLVQLALLKVLRLVDAPEGNPLPTASYLRKVAYTTLIDELRRLRRRREVPLLHEESEEPRFAADGPGPEQQLAARQIGAGIRDCLAALQRPRRLAVTLRLQGHSVPETARILGSNAKQAENLVYRGLADLRRCLGAKGLEP